MALSAQLTKISLPDGLRPSGYTDTAGTNLTASQPTYQNLEIDTVKSTVENADKATTFDALRADIEAQVAILVGTNIENTVQTVAYNIDWKKLRTNQIPTEELFSNGANTYISVVDVYVNIS